MNPFAAFVAPFVSLFGVPAPAAPLAAPPAQVRRATKPVPAPVPAPVPFDDAAPVVSRLDLPLLTPLVAEPPIRVAQADSADAVVGKVQNFYATINHLTAKFRQTVINATFGDEKTSDGMVWLAKPGKMRWDYYAKQRKGERRIAKSFISNGTYLFVVEHENKQVIKKNLEKDLTPVAVSFLYGKGDLRAEFDPAIDTTGRYGAREDLVLKLTPKKPSAQYKNLFLVVDAANYRVKQSIIIDSQDNTNHFRFFEPDFERPVLPKWFLFNEKSVKGYRVVDADKEEAAATKAGATTAP